MDRNPLPPTAHAATLPADAPPHPLESSDQKWRDLDSIRHWIEIFDRLAKGFRFVTSYDRSGTQAHVEYVSEGIQALLGVPATRVMEHVDHLRVRMRPEDRVTLERNIADTIRAGRPLMQLDYRILTPEDAERPEHWLRAMAIGEYQPDGTSRWTGYALDITDLVVQFEQLQSALRDLQATLAASPDIWFEMDAEGRFTRVSTPDPTRLAVPAEQLVGQSVQDVLPRELAERVQATLRRAAARREPQSLQYRLEVGGQLRDFETRIAPRLSGDRVLGYVALARDITEALQGQAIREHALLHDVLTGVWNRTGFLEGGAARWIERLRPSADAPRLLLMLDIDGLRQLNHALGTNVGDDLIKALTQRLLAHLNNGVVGRVGSDELAVLVTLAPDSARGAHPDMDAAEWVEALQRMLSEPIRLGSLDYRPSLTVGWTLLPEGPALGVATVRDALLQVEESLYAAKRQGPGRLERFDPQRFAATRYRHLLAQALSSALTGRELWLAYQPIVDIRGTPIGYEALMRWRSPVHGDVPPGEFIDLAEKSRAIIAMGRWVLREACAQAARASAAPGGPLPYVAINVSPLQFVQPDFEEDIRRALADTGLAPDRLRLEVTESLLIEDLHAVAGKMERLSATGVRFALDDFGTGYSNLLQLRSLPLDTLKIDRSFIRDLFSDENDALIVQSLIELAHRLRLYVVAEGVETDAQADWLRQSGCDALQGYRFGRPGVWTTNG